MEYRQVSPGIRRDNYRTSTETTNPRPDRSRPTVVRIAGRIFSGRFRVGRLDFSRRSVPALPRARRNTGIYIVHVRGNICHPLF